LFEKIDVAIGENKQLDYARREEFVEDAIRVMLKNLSGKFNQESSSKELKSKNGK
jgi:hypothetical protein